MSDTGLVIATSVGSGGVILALAYAAEQARTLKAQYRLQNTLAVRANATERAANDLKLMERIMALDTFFVDRPELRPYFYDGKALPGVDEALLRARVLATAELIVDLADSVISMMRLDQLDDANRDAWIAAIRWYGRSAAVRHVANEAADAWYPETVELLRADADDMVHPVSARGDGGRRLAVKPPGQN